MSDFKIDQLIDSKNINLTGAFFATGQIISTIAQSIPSGWLICDGSEYSKTGTYANLYSKIGTRYGETNGSGGVGTSHFRVPNLVDRYISSHKSGLAAQGDGSHTHTTNANATASDVAVNHYHSVSYGTGDIGSVGYHSHSGGDAYVGANGSNPLNANKTGTGGSGYGSGGAHVHDGYTYGNTNADATNGHGHNIASGGIGSHTAANHSHTHSSLTTSSGNSTNSIISVPSFTVNFMIKV